MTARLAAAALLAAAFLLLVGGSAAGHAYLVSADPPAGATVEQAPAEVRLELNEPVGTDFAQVQVIGPGGARLDTGDAVVEGAVVTQALAELTVPGEHTVAYRLVSADGHPIDGAHTFTYAPAADPLEPEPAPEPELPAAAPTPELQEASAAVRRGVTAARFGNYTALALTVGLLLSAGWLLTSPPARRRAVLLGAAAAGLVLLSALALFALNLANAAALPLGEALRSGRPGRFAQTQFGAVLLAHAVVAVAVGLTALVPRAAAWRAALVLAAVAALGPPLWGHASTASVPAIAVAADWAHVLGATAWVGGLAALVLLAGREQELHRSAARFSRLAGWALVVVGLSGVAHALLHTDELAQLTTTSWGRLLLVKVGLLGVLAAFGWLHRLRTLPGLVGGEVAGFRRFAAGELVVMLVAIGVAATMASGMPASVEAASRIKSLATPFGDGQLNLVVDPGAPGANEAHLYFFGPDGRPRPVDDPVVTFDQPDATHPARLFVAGPGHFVDPRIELPAGHYRIEITGTVDGEERRATATMTLP
jgi:copper transport protein